MRIGLTIRTLDGESREVTVVDGHFRPAGETVDRVVETGGWWAVPGLADCHAHLGGGYEDDNDDADAILERTKANAWAQLEGGVFLVADKGHSTDVTLRVLQTPPTERPELFMAGRDDREPRRLLRRTSLARSRSTSWWLRCETPPGAVRRG